MKKFLYKLFLGIGVVLMLIYYTIAATITYPFRLIQYRRSDFYRETGIPFADAKDTSDLRLFRLFRAAGLPVAYQKPRDLKRANGWFLQGKTLILHMFDELSYSDELQSWTLFPDEGLPLSESVANQLARLRELYPDAAIEDVRILLDRIEVDPKDLPRAQGDPLFLIYGNDDELTQMLGNL
jgi:hypothetical protein